MDKIYDFQTLNEFITNPFRNAKDDKRSQLEQGFTTSKRHITFAGYTQIDDNYLIHIKIPSETKKQQFYDVVILFFTDVMSVKNEVNLKNYYVKFFSNSPGFIYKYAALYNKHGFLIDMFYDKIDSGFINKMPEKANSSMDMFYDKSLYCACRFLQENAITLLNKHQPASRTKDTDKFMKDISSFENVKFGNELKDLDKGINRELGKKKINKRRVSRSNSSNIKKASLSTSSESLIKVVSKKGAISKKGKINSSKSTFKK